MDTAALASGTIILIIGAILVIWGFSQMEKYDWHPGDWYWEDEPGGYEGALYFGLMGGGILMILGLVACIYGAAAERSEGDRPVFREEKILSPPRRTSRSRLKSSIF